MEDDHLERSNPDSQPIEPSRTQAQHSLSKVFDQPTDLDEALHVGVDATVRRLSAPAGMSTDHETAALLLAYAAELERGKIDHDLLATMWQRGIGPGAAQTIARAFTSLALAAVGWCRASPVSAEGSSSDE